MKKSVKASEDQAVSWAEANQKFGARILFYRNQMNPVMTQEELSEIIDRHWTTISRWESGKNGLKMSVSTLLVLCNVFNVKISVMLAGIEAAWRLNHRK